MEKVEWDKDNKPASFEQLIEAVRDVVKQCYKLTRKNKDKDIKWKGPLLPESMRATCLDFEHNLTVERMKYNEYDQGRDAMDVIIGIAIQLGIEQGRRILRKDMDITLNIMGRLSRDCEISAYIRELKDFK